MLSRVAESLYWMSRYIERAENVARMIDVNFNLMLDWPSYEENFQEQWEPIIITSGDEEKFKEKYNIVSRENVINFLTFDEENPNSILSCIKSARFNARTVRESISPEMFEEVNNAYHFINNHMTAGVKEEDLKFLYDYLRKFSHLFLGLANRTMLRDEGWNFICLGRVLERADKITRILDVKYFILLPTVSYVNTPYDDIQWTALLKTGSAFEAYRKKHHRIEYDKIIEFLILENAFPRSVRYCLNSAEAMLKAIDRQGKGMSVQSVQGLNAELKNTGVREIKFYGLHEYLDLIQQKVNKVGSEIYSDFFSLSFS